MGDPIDQRTASLYSEDEGLTAQSSESRSKGRRLLDTVVSKMSSFLKPNKDNTDQDTGNHISRRDFLKIAGLGIAAAVLRPNSSASAESDYRRGFESTELIEFKENEPDQITSLGAIEAAVYDFDGKPYTWESPNLHCSGFIGAYMKHLGFNVEQDLSSGKYIPDTSKPFPEATTVKQGPYLEQLNKELGGDLVAYVPVKEMISNEKLWEEVPPGTVMYLPEPVGHHGYDQYTHTTIFMGLDKNGQPMFAEFSPYMKNGPQYGHGFDKFIKMYAGKSITASDPKNEPLKVLMFDAVEASRRYGLEKGAVKPDEKLFKELGYNAVISININDGTLSVSEVDSTGVHAKVVNGKEKYFTVVGRRLKRNKYLSYEYRKGVFTAFPFSMYDSISGTHIEQSGSRRNTYTPPMIADLAGTEVLADFGSLGKNTSTDICLLRQISYNPKSGKFVYSEKYSPYTLHEVPRGTGNQEILLREPQLVTANANGVPLSEPNLSSGCVNMDGESWRAIKNFAKRYLENGKKVAVMFSTPNMDQRSLIRDGNESTWFYGDDPFGGKIKSWSYKLEEGVGHDNWIYVKRPKSYPRFQNSKK